MKQKLWITLAVCLAYCDEWIELRRKIRNEQIPLRQLERENGVKKVSIATSKSHIALLVIYLLTTCNPHFDTKNAI
ncbi:MAG: hypothetical protein GY845_29985 [Planctomycetes bacterium]|nr:hypothetical protein [Planctomycetota bacterium]